MGVFFGTDGLRGKVNGDLSYDLAYRCGNALSSFAGVKAKILIGTDTRKSASLIMLGFACGAVNGGARVTSVGVCPTAGVSYLTKTLGYDFGVVISASHNPAEFNGIKIFDKTGIKLSEKQEEQIEKLFLKESALSFDKLGTFEFLPKYVNLYKEFLINSSDCLLDGLKIVLDLSNGASSFIAPKVFKKLKAKVIVLSGKPDGLNINRDCGALFTRNLVEKVKKCRADIGLAFDGDSDRLIAVDERGNVVDGDKLIYLFACIYKKYGRLTPSIIVGTRHTNMGVEQTLGDMGIKLIRTEIGDKYVSSKLIEQNLLIGGEQSGHIILRDKHVTGDGILAGVMLASILKKEQKPLSSYFNFECFKQANINVEVHDKMKVINSEKLSKEIEKEEQCLCGKGRIMVRVSGTEPFIRIMVETKSKQTSEVIAQKMAQIVSEVDRELWCAELFVIWEVSEKQHI